MRQAAAPSHKPLSLHLGKPFCHHRALSPRSPNGDPTATLNSNDTQHAERLIVTNEEALSTMVDTHRGFVKVVKVVI